MNHFRSHKIKLNAASNESNNAGNENININNNGGGSSGSGGGGGKGFLTRIKRYSTLGNKLGRRHLTGSSSSAGNSLKHRRGSSNSPPKLLSGSYNMTGANSEDHRLEIGAPILISTTTLDTDRFGVTEARLKQIGGGIAVNSIIVPTSSMQSSPQIHSSSSENEVYVDALSTPQVEEDLREPAVENLTEDYEEEPPFVSPCETPAHLVDRNCRTKATTGIEQATFTAPSTDAIDVLDSIIIKNQAVTNVPLTHINNNNNNTQVDEVVVKPSITKTASPSSSSSGSSSTNILTELNDQIRAPMWRPRHANNSTQLRHRQQQQKSQSVQNLHTKYARVYKSPSLVVMDMNVTAPELNIPDLPELFGHSEENVSNKENTSPAQLLPIGSKSKNLHKSEPNTPVVINAEQKVCGFLAHQERFNSLDSFQFAAHTSNNNNNDVHSNDQRRLSDRYTSNTSIGGEGQPDQHHHHRGHHSDNYFLGSKQSLASFNSQFTHMSHHNSSSAIEDFDLKSASYQSLNGKNISVSIDELNEITRQINETEEFSSELDLEYCQHRDNLKPSERRITLLKNKNSRLISFNHNKEKIKKGWNGVKHWLGEESSRLKEAVQKQTPLKRLGASKLNLSQSPDGGQNSVSPVRPMESRERSPGDRDISPPAGNDEHDHIYDDHTKRELSVSCENVTESSVAPAGRGALAAAELNSSFHQIQQRPSLSDEDLSPNAKRFKDEGQNGFEELRRYVKQGGDFSKELILILQERIDSELIYSKSLSKMANKLNKACRELPGSIAEAWRGVATEMESRSDIHRQLAASLTDEIVKPLKTIVDSHHKARKAVESNVDKAARNLSDWRTSEAKAKKASHTAARENEKLQDAMLDIRIQKSPSIALLHQGTNKIAAEKEYKSAEKDCVKLDNKRKKAEEAVKRADVGYYTVCVRAERARVDWEMSVLRGSAQLQSCENQRLINMKNFVSQYIRLTADMNPISNSLVQGLQPHIEGCNVAKDMQVVKNIRRNSEGPSEQLLPDFYCEHTTLAMNRERRKHSLVKLLHLVKTDLERERRSRDGLRGLSQSLSNQEHQNIADKLYHIRSMLTYLEGARLKLHSALLELDHKPPTTHPLSQHIQITRDRTGLQQSILKVPNWLKNNDKLNNSNSSTDETCATQECDEDADNLTTVTPTTTTTISQQSPPPLSSNMSCANINEALNGGGVSKGHLNQPFSRSKSNIETLSSNPKMLTNATTAKVQAPNKSKTLLSNNLNGQLIDRGQADGGSNQQDSEFDEFSSQDDTDDDEDVDSHNRRHDDEDIKNMANLRKAKQPQQQQQQQEQFDYHQHHQQNHYQNTQEIQQEQQQQQNLKINNNNNNNDANSNSNSGVHVVLGRCKALYSYTPKLYDELELNPGDIIEVHAKQDDGWWLGALRNQIGIFPATYVEEFA